MSFDEKYTAASDLSKGQEQVTGENKTRKPSYGSDDGDNARTIEDRRLLRKLDLKLLPALTLLYLLSFLDRSNAGNQYLTGLTIYFVGYVLFEVVFSPA
ncbi:MAG: hypothetical protein Q9195_009452 [Heterodermia aff. obscurata]